MSIKVGGVVVRSGREDGEVESGERGVVGDGDDMAEGEGEDVGSEVKRRVVDVEKALLRPIRWSIHRRRRRVRRKGVSLGLLGVGTRVEGDEAELK